MYRLLSCVALAAVVAQPVAAQTLLYATSGSQRRVDAYRVNGDGTLIPDPVHQRTMGGPRPRRLLVRECNLYVGEQDRVEVYRIRSGGRLEAIGATRRTKAAQLHDFELAPDGRTLYVPIRREGQIAAYPLDEEGKPSADLITENNLPAGGPTSCVYGPGSWEDLEIANGKLYVAFTSKVNVYGIDATGNLVGAARVPQDLDDPPDGVQEGETVCPPYSVTPADRAEECLFDSEVKPKPDRPDDTCPFSFRSRVQGGVGLVVNGKTAIVGERFIHRLTGFQLDDAGNFPYIPTIVEDPCAPCTIVADECVCPKGCNASCSPPGDPFPDVGKKDKKKERRSRKKNRTDETIRYIGLTFHRPVGENPIVYGAGFSGRVDAFRLKDDGTLPKVPGGSTPKDVTSTPVRTAIGSSSGGRPVLYVAAGERDRVQVFPLFPGGLIDPDRGPDETSELAGSFPNDVVLTDITSCD